MLDFGCGAGYGTHSLANDSESCVGIDIGDDAIEFARNHYSSANLEFRSVAPVQDEPLPFPDDTFDVVLSFQVIEHVDGVQSYLGEIDRVLAPGGVFICATPNRLTRLFPKQRPWNVYHLYEYEPSELADLLRSRFTDLSLFGMTADPNLVSTELARCRKRQLVAYPFTFPGAPESWRRAGLRLLKRVQRPKVSTPSNACFDLDHTAIRIEPDASPSVNIVAVGRA